jgi:hypothetical protein
MLIQLHHPTDPRYLLVDELPERVTVEELGAWLYGKPLLFPVTDVDAEYEQPGGPGTDWVRPAALSDGPLESI